MSKKYFEVVEHVSTVFRIEANTVEEAKKLFLSSGPTDGKRRVVLTSADYVWQDGSEE